MIDAKFKWELADNAPSLTVDNLEKELGISRILATLLAQQGIDSTEQAKKFFEPSMEEIHDPTLLHDMDKAVERIEQAVEKQEQITIYGDYDADGITSTSLMYETLLSIGANVNYYVPNRFTDGYGPNMDAYQRLIDNGTQLFITVDNGVSGKNVINKVMAAGVDVVITDHHELPADLPNAVAIVHPRYPGSNYPFPDLSGVGVAFKVAWALTGEFPVEELDLVAIGEIADVVNVTDENHALISYGIQQLRQGMRPGLAALMKLADIKANNLTDQDIGFGIAPRLNALGRIADANDGVKLLTSLDENESQKLAKEVDQANKERQNLVAEIMKEAEKQANSSANQQKRTLLIVGKGWHQGVLGIVASRIMNETGKPTIIASTDQNNPTLIKGSGRSVDSFNLFNALEAHCELFTTFGGHPAACGLSFDQKNIVPLQIALEEETGKQKFDPMVKQPLPIAMKLAPADVTQQLYNDIQRVAPFGPGNMEPVFELNNVKVVDVKTMGQEHQHLKFSIVSDKKNLTVVAFGQGNLATLLSAPTGQINLAVKVSLNEWRGKKTVQLMLEDLQINGTVIIDERTNKLTPQLFSSSDYYIVREPRLRENIAPHVAPGYTLSIEEAIKTDFSGQQVTLVDCPSSEEMLKQIFAEDEGEPATIRLLLYQRKSAYLAGLPTRNDFAQLYRFIYKQKEIKWPMQAKAVSNHLKINMDRLNLMIQVFSEAGFVTIKDDVLKFNEPTNKTDLTQTKRYQKQLAQYKVEQQLLFNDAATVAKWLLEYLNLE
ncbi:single-stranded-DNA-specific exonuclease RecJ [Limosilactobacillus reuteri]|jgi:single-stranded-DNA-specific exonuclease|uniref:Single-stranded-DNA-specific exonuclease RecJ n=2 Tax=Limosilactobacillus reuteri TaxID=1598 RepID=R9WH14_LIMRT|nr:single-stranded-DNA-specific exonuclease RecJ [Limosilactobacillus reuteri]CCC03033.1 putative single-strand DNA exonuclease [Limosilactobacillus reuteri subsp. suis]AGN99444.1 single-stranded-DNA-specific exonuclease RecJ [Limosilactobacillus reuteri I5007]AMY13435.1 single-stranded-DNA-specific exonuclease RecJ [Limosilactobacillus reuteri]MCC4366830.1 single-stranded-DNA-specific exonuclease RecJ [Limosilactobacillus reuteri]MCC4389733.1 single-stranded-DNA-specific exonuclease RecJ [Lim